MARLTFEAKPAGKFVDWARRNVYHPVGFRTGYNFVLWFIFGGAIFGFSLSRFMYLNWNTFCPTETRGPSAAAPGECFYYNSNPAEKIGMLLHLATILPAGLLVPLQFVPAIRYKAILVHRVNGYLIILLSLAGVAGALMITRHAFGGQVETHVVVGVLTIGFLGSLLLAYINIKRLQIEQHRAWMLRAWFYVTGIISLRFIMPLGAVIITSIGGYYQARPCAQIDSIFKNNQTSVLNNYPECADFYSGANPDRHVAVLARIQGMGTTGATAAAALGANFGMAGWLALILHGVGVEIYLRLTPGEHERLRQVSYKRQREAGFKNPGRAGITADRIGDTYGHPWSPPSENGEQLGFDGKHHDGGSSTQMQNSGALYEKGQSRVDATESNGSQNSASGREP